MPMMALIRNLANLTRRRLADDSEVVASIVERLTDPTAIRQSRIHPVHYLLAHRTYARGYSQSSRNHWEPVPAITKALEQGLSIAFSALDQDPSPASVLIALDTSGSMSSCTGVGAVENMTAIEIGVFLAMVIARTFPNHTIWGFDTACHPLRIDPNASLDKALRSISAGGGTDISAPIFEAIRQRVAADALVIVTDNETWRNRVPIHEAMQRYRKAVQRNTALVVIATSLTQYSVADPHDPNSLNIAGFDANIPTLIQCFAERTCSVQQPRQININPEED
jgi:60 kDa SS-A/Ro ribonucleoprotein